jgi:hypothetical protein
MSLPVQTGRLGPRLAGKDENGCQQRRHEQPVEDAGRPDGEPGSVGLAGADVELHGHGRQNGRRRRPNG